MKLKTLLFSVVLAVTSVASAEVMDRPGGIKIGERMILRPYVSLSYTFDSNIDSDKHGDTGSQWSVNPGLDLTYKGGNWDLTGSVYYQYHAYNKYASQLNDSSYGESLRFNWGDGEGEGRGWRLTLAETFRQISQDDDMSTSGGRGIGRDRHEFNFDGGLQRRLGSYWHLALTGGYYLMDYDNNVNKYGEMYGWKRATLGGEAGFTTSKWMDLLFHIDHQWYWQDNNVGNLSGDSKGLSVMGGFGSYATERISYRLLAGWSRFEYGRYGTTSNGFTYQASANWQMSDTLHFMLLGSSYYQPSETYQASQTKVNTISAGLGKSLVRGKLNATFDIAFRNEKNEYAGDEDIDFAATDNILTTRFGLNYSLNRFLSMYGSVEYQINMASGDANNNSARDYDRLRGTVGFRLTY